LDPTSSLFQVSRLSLNFNLRESRANLEREISRFGLLHLKLFQENAAKFMAWSSVITSYSSLTQETACCILLLVFHYVLYYGCEPEYWKAPLSDPVTAVAPYLFYQEYKPSIALEAYEMYHSLKMVNLPAMLTEARRKLNLKFI